MKVPVVITAAGPSHSHLLHQTLVTTQNQRLTMARFILDLVGETAQRIAFVVSPESADSIGALVVSSNPAVSLIEQPEPLGYADALYRARDFVAGEPFLHLVGDHFYLADQALPPKTLITELFSLFEREHASISAVQPTRESLIGSFGAVGGPAIAHQKDSMPVFQVDRIHEKPTPTEAEQFLVSPGLRAGHYLCFFGIHLFTPGLMEILETEFFANGRTPASVSEVLQLLARRERYLACVLPGRRFDLGAKYGLLQAQLALSLQGPDRGDVLELMVELLAR